jgi:TolB protein
MSGWSNADGSVLLNLTQTTPGSDYSPSWSPDGEYLAFTSNRSGSDDIWVMKSDGSDAINLTADRPTIDDFAIWSPDGKLIAFVSERTKDQYDVWVMNADGSNPVNLTIEGEHSYMLPNWSPDNQSLIMLSRQISPPYGSAGVWIANLQDGTLNNIIADFPHPQRNDLYAAWSPKSDLIALSDIASSAIWLIQADGSELINITQDMSDIPGIIVWSPDGERIAFQCVVDICRMNHDGSDRIKLTNGGIEKQIGNFYPTWSFDSQSIAFESNQEGNSDIWIMNADGSYAINLTRR